jgi:hypothetical protein
MLTSEDGGSRRDEGRVTHGFGREDRGWMMDDGVGEGAGDEGREKFSRKVARFGRKALMGRGLIVRLCKWRGFRGLQLFFTGFHRFFMVFSRDFHAEATWFSWVAKKEVCFLFFYRRDAETRSHKGILPPSFVPHAGLRRGKQMDTDTRRWEKFGTATCRPSRMRCRGFTARATAGRVASPGRRRKDFTS